MHGSNGYKVVFHRPFELFNGVVVEGETIIEPNRAQGGKKGEHYLYMGWCVYDHSADHST